MFVDRFWLELVGFDSRKGATTIFPSIMALFAKQTVIEMSSAESFEVKLNYGWQQMNDRA